MKKQFELNEHMDVLTIFYKLNAMNSCEADDREWIYWNAHRPGFKSRGFCRDCEIFEGILEMKNQIRKVLLHNDQKFLIDLV